MKKLLLSLLVPTIALALKDEPHTHGLNNKYNQYRFSTQNHAYREALASFDESDKFFHNPEYLKFILGWDKHLDLHFYGVMTPAYAEIAVDRIHQNLRSELKKQKSSFEAGKALAQKTGTADAEIVRTCSTIEQRLRKNDDEFGKITGKDPIARFFAARTFDGQKFFDNACPCDIYQNLSNEQLAQLQQGIETVRK